MEKDENYQKIMDSINEIDELEKIVTEKFNEAPSTVPADDQTEADAAHTEASLDTAQSQEDSETHM